MYDSFWAQFIDPFYLLADGSRDPKVPCPFHPWNAGREDENPSMSVNLDTGLYQCWSCADLDGPLAAKGDAATFVSSYFDVPISVGLAYRDIFLESGEAILPVSEDQIIAWKENLKTTTKMWSKIQTERGLDGNTIDAFHLGWDGERIVIPIENYRGEWVTYRRYTFNRKLKAKYLNPSTQRYKISSKRLWPMSIVIESNAPFILFAGEWDRILAVQLGITNAVTTIGGEGMRWRDEWDRFISGRTIWICYDIDKAGRADAQKLASRLSQAGAEVRIINLPISEPANGDFTDFIVTHGNTADDFRHLVADAPVWSPQHVQVDNPITSMAGPSLVTLTASTFDPHWQGHRVQIEAQVAGRDSTPYTIVRKANLTCDKMSDDNPLCTYCPLRETGAMKLDLTPEKDLLHLIRVSDAQKIGAIQKLAGLPKCPLWEMEVEQSQNVEEVLITPRVEAGVVNGLYVDQSLQTIYHFYEQMSQHVEDSKSYILSGVRTTEPWKQKAIHVVDAAIPVKDSISEFKLTDRVRSMLEENFSASPDAIGDAIATLAHDLTHRVTRVIGREDLVTAILLGYATTQRFSFLGQMVDGLSDILVIGDTRTGKSEAAFNMIQHLRLGELVMGEAVSFSGLVAGLHKGASDNWVVAWGRIPMNNGGIVAIDEVSGMPVEQIGQMSGLRSRRIASIVKIRQAETSARTRQLWLSNPRSARKMRDFTFGVDAVMELIGQPEDVARFDLVISCSGDDVSLEEINAERPIAEPPDPVPLRTLVLYAWSRKEHQVVFTSDAERACLAGATAMAQIYSSSVPIIEGANHRMKLARLAAAAAVLTFSTDETGEIVVVRPEHVTWVQRFMDACYRKESLGYFQYSRREKGDIETAESSREWVMNYFRTDLIAQRAADLIDRSETFRSQDLQDQLDISRDEASIVITRLSSRRMIDRKGANLYKTATLIQILRELKSDGVLQC